MVSDFCSDDNPEERVSNFHGEPEKGEFKHVLIRDLNDLIASAEHMLSQPRHFNQDCLSNNLKLENLSFGSVNEQNDAKRFSYLLDANENVPVIKSCDRFNDSNICRSITEFEAYFPFSMFCDVNSWLRNTSVNNSEQLIDTEFPVRSVNSSKCIFSKDSSVKFVAGCVKTSSSSGRPDTSIGVRQAANTIGVIGQCHRHSSDSVRLVSQLAIVGL